ncbi:MAG: hypothetical protein R6W97_01695, partial [Thiobacillus sp.]
RRICACDCLTGTGECGHSQAMLGYDIDNLALYFVGDSGQKEVRSVWTLNAVCLTFCASCFGAIAFAGAAGMVIAFALI